MLRPTGARRWLSEWLHHANWQRGTRQKQTFTPDDKARTPSTQGQGQSAAARLSRREFTEKMPILPEEGLD